MKYFTGIKTLEELKNAYHKLALKYHPDRPDGDAEIMKVVNAEYDEVFESVKNTHYSSKNKEYYTTEKENAETPDEFKDLIDALLKMEGITIQIVGCFVWVSGDTKPHKDALKALGMRWSRNKGMWYKSPAGYRKKSKRVLEYSEICGMYGVQATYKAEDKKKITA